MSFSVLSSFKTTVLNKYECITSSEVYRSPVEYSEKVLHRSLNAYDKYTAKYTAEFFKRNYSYFPLDRFKQLPPIGTMAAMTIPIVYLSSCQSTILGCLTIGCAILPYVIDRGVKNCFINDTLLVIKNSQLEQKNKEGVALILNASKLTDYNSAFGYTETNHRSIELLAEKFIIQSVTVFSPQQLSNAIEEVCKKNAKPVKLVIIQAHGQNNSIALSVFCDLYKHDDNLVNALRKTDKNVHIILKSCCSGHLRNENEISFADHLSFKLPGRMVTGNPSSSASILIKNNHFPQNITLQALNVDKEIPIEIPTHSYCAIANKRIVTTLLPREKMPQYRLEIPIDNKYKEVNITNEYRPYFSS